MRPSLPAARGSTPPRPLLPPLAVLALALLASPLGCQCGADATTSPAPSSSAAPAGSEAALASSAPARGPLVALGEQQEVPQVVGAYQIVVAFKGAELAPPTVTRSREEARRRAEEALARVKQGSTSFEELAKTYSDDVSKAAGGAMGNFERSAVPPALGDAAFALKVGELSGIVETARGFHIVRRVR